MFCNFEYKVNKQVSVILKAPIENSSNFLLTSLRQNKEFMYIQRIINMAWSVQLVPMTALFQTVSTYKPAYAR